MLSTISMFPQVMHMCNTTEAVQSWYRRPGYKLKYICITITCWLHALAGNNTGHRAPRPSGCSSRRDASPLPSSQWFFGKGSYILKIGLPLYFSHKDLSTFSPTCRDTSLFPDRMILAGGEGIVFPHLMYKFAQNKHKQSGKLKASKGGHPNGSRVTGTKQIFCVLAATSILSPPTCIQKQKKIRTPQETLSTENSSVSNNNGVREWTWGGRKNKPTNHTPKKSIASLGLHPNHNPHSKFPVSSSVSHFDMIMQGC